MKERFDRDFSPSTPHQAGIPLNSSCGPGKWIIPKYFLLWIGDGFVASIRESIRNIRMKP